MRNDKLLRIRSYLFPPLLRTRLFYRHADPRYLWLSTDLSHYHHQPEIRIVCVIKGVYDQYMCKRETYTCIDTHQRRWRERERRRPQDSSNNKKINQKTHKDNRKKKTLKIKKIKLTCNISGLN